MWYGVVVVVVVVLMEWVDEYTCRCVKGYFGPKLVAMGCGGVGVVVVWCRCGVEVVGCGVGWW